jgi:hypothetical protein
VGRHEHRPLPVFETPDSNAEWPLDAGNVSSASSMRLRAGVCFCLLNSAFVETRRVTRMRYHLSGGQRHGHHGSASCIDGGRRSPHRGYSPHGWR